MTDVLLRIDAFCDAVPRSRAAVVDRGPLRLFVRNGAGWPYYARPVPGGRPVDRDDVQRMRTLMRARRLPETFEWVHTAAPTMEAAVHAAGLHADVFPTLVLDGDPVTVPPPPPGYVVRLLGPADGDLADAEFAVRTVASSAFGGPRPGRPDADELDALRDALVDGQIARALVTGPDGPVASGAAQRAGDVVELVGIATLEPARGRGLAAAVTSALARAARHAEAEVVFLSAADAGAARVYERVGFRTVGTSATAEPAPAAGSTPSP